MDEQHCYNTDKDFAYNIDKCNITYARWTIGLALPAMVKLGLSREGVNLAPTPSGNVSQLLGGIKPLRKMAKENFTCYKTRQWWQEKKLGSYSQPFILVVTYEWAQ